MADIHTLTGGHNSWRVVMHFPVPDVNNEASVNYRIALANSGLSDTVMTTGTGPGQITSEEAAEIAAGAVYEHVVDFRLEGNGYSAVAIRDAVRSKYLSEKIRITLNLQNKLKYFGYTESEV